MAPVSLNFCSACCLQASGDTFFPDKRGWIFAGAKDEQLECCIKPTLQGRLVPRIPDNVAVMARFFGSILLKLFMGTYHHDVR